MSRSRNINDIWLRLNRQLLLILLFSSLPIIASADTYKWLDKDGKVHYSDSQPRDAECEKIEIEQDKKAHCAEIAERKRRLDEAEKEADRRIEERRKRLSEVQASRDAHLAKQQQCFDARKQLVVLQTQMPVYRDVDGQIRAAWMYDTYEGDRQYLDDAARANEITKTRQSIATLCQHPDDSVARANARKQWIRSERCASARSQLEAMKRPQAKTSDRAIERKLDEVNQYCNDE